MELNLKGKTAAVTGASKGIGLGIAQELAGEGVNLHIAARNGDELKAAADGIKKRFGVSVATHAVDLSKRGPRDAFAHEVAGVDILVNCAGAIPGGTLDQVDEDRWREGWELKLFGYFGITRIVYKEMCNRRRGVIINIVGAGGVLTGAGYICGGPGNAAVINFTNSLGGESIRYGVRVVGINPGPVDTPRLQWLQKQAEEKVAPQDLENWRRNRFNGMAYGRPARVDEISGMAAFLASDRAAYITGTMINIEGGTIARGGAPGAPIGRNS
jgi:NAD(P)-dependent dehydrogenase (short-subunit alcohol dehydrogenase family)